MTIHDDPNGSGRDLDAELRVHHDLTVADLQRCGLSRDQAEAEARRRFGDRQAWRRRILRDERPRRPLGAAIAGGVGALGRDVRFAVRSLRRAPLLAGAVIAVLGLGLAAVAIALALINGVLMKPLAYDDPDRLTYIWGRNPDVRAGFPNLPISEPDLADWRAHATEIGRLGGVVPATLTLTGDGDPEQLGAGAVVGDLFGTLGVAPLHGRTLQDRESADAAPPVVLGHALWRSRFGGDPAVIDRVIRLNDRPHRIVGVLPAGFAFPHVAEIGPHYGFSDDIALYVPWRSGDAGPVSRGNRYIVAVGRLRPGASGGEAARELDAISAEGRGERPPPSRSDRFALVSFREQAIGGVRRPVWLFTLAVAGVLGIACLNVAQLLLVRVAGRQPELAVRLALGSGRWALLRQIVIEGVLLAGVGGAAGILAATWAIAALHALSPPGLPRLDAIAVDRPVVLASLGLATLAGVIVALVPAARLGLGSISDRLRQSTRSHTRGDRHGPILAGLEIGICVVLLVLAGLIVRSLWRVTSIAPGFEAARVMTFQLSLPAARYPTSADLERGYDAMLDRLRDVRGVSHAAITWQLPMSGTQGATGYVLEDGSTGMALIHRVSADYFRTVGMQLRRGRGLDAPTDLAPLVVNERLAAVAWPGADPIGRVATVNGVKSRVVGVVNDVHHLSLEEQPSPEMYQLGRLRTMFVAVKTDEDPAALLPSMRRAVADVDAAVPLSNVRPMAERLSGTTTQRRLMAGGLGIFATLAALLALVGVYGVTAILVTRRRREVGIRLALGATPGGAVRLLVSRMLPVIVAGLTTGLVIAALVAGRLSSLLFGISAWDPVTYAGVGVGLAAAGVLAIYVPARQASRISPSQTLRGE